ncbi:sulfonate ABC transporter substrate-binding protein [Alicyclobacillus acidoterrestris]|uniref:sulfonate ABC transporter substrate-binding protein n=1 Tax=Alicyclobacillus acidoterrestris TaxID=1450 RepID=UPI00119237A8|nr:sulfonate ABC transporter substrate-binding protein [Alicyclobacillus acidoterrestris]
MTGWYKGVLGFAVAATVFAVSGCGNSTTTGNTGTGAATSATDKGTIRIGYQLYGTSGVMMDRGILDKQLKKLGYKVQWIQFPGGPQLLQAMNAGAIDLGETGDTPPIFAQSAGTPLVYLAHEPASPEAEAILVSSQSGIKSVKDLKGKTVAINKGSNVEYMLVQQLQKAGLTFQDITPDYLTPADARAAFQSGKVSAWAIWDPYLASAQDATKSTEIASGSGVTNNYQFYFATKTFAQSHPDIVQDYLNALQQTDTWVKNNKVQAAKFLAPKMDISVKALETSLNRRAYGVEPITNDVVDEQQNIANLFYKLGLIPNAITVKDDVWSGNVGKGTN